MPRVKLLAKREDVAPEHHALYDELAALRGRLSGPATVVMHSPALSKPWNDQSEFLHRETIVDVASYELAVSAAARERDCQFVWNAHSKHAHKEGIGEVTIKAVRDYLPLDGLPTHDAAIVSYTRQLLRNNRVDQATFDTLLNAHGPKWLVELTGFIGRYAALSNILNSFEVLPGADAAPLPIPSPNPPGARGPVAQPRPTPRVAPITQREQVAEGDRVFYDAVAKARGKVTGPFGILMHSPKLCMLVNEVSRYLKSRSSLKPNVCELCTIAVAREKDCSYVWSSHVGTARKAGVSEDAIAAVRDRKDLARLAQDDADIIDHVRQLHRTNRVTQPLFDRLRERNGIPWLVELTALIGHFGMVTAQLNAFEVAPKPDAEQLPL